MTVALASASRAPQGEGVCHRGVCSGLTSPVRDWKSTYQAEDWLVHIPRSARPGETWWVQLIGRAGAYTPPLRVLTDDVPPPSPAHGEVGR